MSMGSSTPLCSGKMAQVLYRPRLWVWTAIILSILVCSVVSLLFFQQRQTIKLTLGHLEDLRQARIDLSRGYLQASQSGQRAASHGRVEGMALLRQALDSFANAQTHLIDVVPDAAGELRRSVSLLQEAIAALPHRKPEDRLSAIVALQVAIDDLDRQADGVDRQIQRHLLQLATRLDKFFVVTLTGAALLLTVLCAVVFCAGRITDRFAAASRESDERFQKAMAATSDGLWDWNILTGEVYYSPAYWRMLGYEVHEVPVTVQAWLDLLHPDDCVRTLAASLDCIENRRQNFEAEFRLRARDDSWRWILGRGEVVGRDDVGRALRMIGTHVDITERKRHEADREATIAILRICNGAADLRELMGDLLVFFRNLLGCDAVAVRLRSGTDAPYFDTLGFSEEFIAAESSLCDGGHGEPGNDQDVSACFDCMCGTVISGKVPRDLPWFTERGSFWTNDADQLIAGVAATCLPNGGRNRCLREGYQSLVLVPLRISHEIHGLFQFASQKAGCVSREMVALLEDLADHVALAMVKLQTDNAFMDSCQFSQQVINSVEEGVVVLDTDLRYQVWNPYMERLSGIPAEMVMGRKLQEVFPFFASLGVIERAEATLADRKPPTVDFSISFDQGEHSVWVSESCSPLKNRRDEIIGVIVTIRDIAQHKLMEEQLLQAQKMEAVGQLAGGVAHDFNNILTVIYGYCHMLQALEVPGGIVEGHVDQILAAAERASNLTRSLLAFSRKQSMSMQTVNLNDLILSVAKLLNRIIGEDVTLKTSFRVNPLPVTVDSGQIEQVLMNLAANARDAMPHGGLLTLETRLEELGDDFVQSNGFGVPGWYAVLAVTDTGVGMDRHTMEKIFEPFFTTKGVGKGTGLGLAIAYGVVKQHKGFITAISEPGQGTTFTVYLPNVSTSCEVVVDPVEGEYPRMGTETVLMAEDDPSIRQLADSVLKKFGYEVIFALDGVDAVEKYRANAEKIAIVLLDMIMPGKNGKEACEEIRALRPDVRVLFMSGYSPDLLEAKGILHEMDEVLVKPFHPLDLVRKIRSSLDHPKSSVEGSPVPGV